MRRLPHPARAIILACLSGVAAAVLAAVGSGFLFGARVPEEVRIAVESRWIRFSTGATPRELERAYGQGVSLSAWTAFDALVMLDSLEVERAGQVVVCEPSANCPATAITVRDTTRVDVSLRFVDASRPTWVQLAVDSVEPAAALRAVQRPDTAQGGGPRWREVTRTPLEIDLPAGYSAELALSPTPIGLADYRFLPIAFRTRPAFVRGRDPFLPSRDPPGPASAVLKLRSTDQARVPPSIRIDAPTLWITGDNMRFAVGDSSLTGALTSLIRDVNQRVVAALQLRDEAPFTVTLTPRGGAGAGGGLALLGGLDTAELVGASGEMSVGGEHLAVAPTDRLALAGELTVGIEFERGGPAMVEIAGRASSASLNGAPVLPTRWERWSPEARGALIGGLGVGLLSLFGSLRARRRAEGGEARR